MTKRLTWFALAAVFAAASGVQGCKKNQGGGDRAAPAAGEKVFRLAVIPKGSTNQFWKSIEAGARGAATEISRILAARKPKGITGVEILWKGPLREDDREQQIQVVEGFVAQGVDGILLAPLDARALVRPVEEAARSSIPTVIFDSALDSKNIVSFVATDNERGGELAAERIGQQLGGRGKAILLRFRQGSASTEAREAGFLRQLRAAYPGIELVSSDQQAGASRDSAKQASENLLNRFGNDLQAVFTPNESSTDGMLLALQDIGKAGKICFVGFDATPSLIDAVKKGQISGLVVQNPRIMGDRAVRIMVSHLFGEKVEPVVQTAAVLVTGENLNDPAIAELLAPLPEREAR